MIPYRARKFIRHPLRAAWNSFSKRLIGPLRYARGQHDYDVERYWEDRLRRHGRGLRGPGDEGLSETENLREYEVAGSRFLELCEAFGVDMAAARIIEIGVGTGFYTDLMQNYGAESYLGIDVTDVLFSEIRRRHPAFSFEKMDITESLPAGQFDLVVMMDVIEHIVSREKFVTAVDHVRRLLAPGGLFIISGLNASPGKRLFYVRGWRPEEVIERFPRYEVMGPIRYRSNLALCIQAPAGEEPQFAPSEASSTRS